MSTEKGLQDLEREIAAAQDALLAVAREAPDKWWNAPDLRRAAQNGWGGDVMTYALTDLVNREELELDAELCVRLKSK